MARLANYKVTYTDPKGYPAHVIVRGLTVRSAYRDARIMKAGTNFKACLYKGSEPLTKSRVLGIY